MRPDAASIVRARDESSRPSALNASDAEHADAATSRRASRASARRTPARAKPRNARPRRPAAQPREQERQQVVVPRHRRRDQPLQQLAPPRVDDREADAPDRAAHQVHAEQSRHEEVDVARARLAHQLVVRGDRIRAPGAAAARPCRHACARRALRGSCRRSGRRREPSAGRSTSNAIFPSRSARRPSSTVENGSTVERGSRARTPSRVRRRRRRR